MGSLPAIVNVYPANGAVGIPIGDSITVTFDQEMDEDSINTGTFVLSGPDKNVFFGGEMNPFEEPGLNSDDILDSPYFPGFVQCEITFQRVDASGSPVDDSEVDYDGEGNLWRTVAVLTPKEPLASNKDYQALVLGDEDTTNAFDSGVRTRTVFDANPVAVTGDAVINSGGGYTGSSERVYYVEITVGGQTGNATYKWWREFDPFTIYSGITVTGRRELEDGVYITCDPDGTFVTGDKWKIVCKPFTALGSAYQWTFTTGSGSILTPPSQSSASGIDDIAGITATTSTAASTFSVSEVEPTGGEYGVTISTDPYSGERITITFNNDIDSSTLVNNVEVKAEPAIGIDANATGYTTDLGYTVSVSGTKTLIIDLDPGQLYQNNIVVVTLDKDIADTNGTTLGSDYTTYFSTTYAPIYTTLRRIQLEIGPLIANVSEETIMLAILEASLFADACIFGTDISNVTYFNMAKREFTTCKACLMLVNGIASDGAFTDRMSKTLGDLTVSRGGARENIQDLTDKYEGCLAYWKPVLETGGEISPDTSLKPGYTVKGSNSEDAMYTGRQWEPTSGLGYYRPASNTKVTTTSSRKYLKTWRNTSWRNK